MVTRKLIVFFIPEVEVVNGGVMSIFSLCRESRRFENIHGSEVVLCTYPGQKSYKKNRLFENNEYIYSFEEIKHKYKSLDYLQLHIPELAVSISYNGLLDYEQYLSHIKEIHINILNQNILYMPEATDLACLRRFTTTITQSTAHDRYATQEICNKYALPLKHMSVFIDGTQYINTPASQKENLIVYSRDYHPVKEAIIKHLRQKLGDYQFIEIDGYTYAQYKELISRARFAITFGEGLDGYFIEEAFSGGITFAAYNNDFFPESFKSLPNVYEDYASMKRTIYADLRRLENEKEYVELNKEIVDKLADLYSFKKYLNNLRGFYLEKFDYYPSNSALHDHLNELSVAYSHIKEEKNEAEKIYIDELRKRNSDIELQASTISNIYGSLSWKITKPLRIASRVVGSRLKLP